MTQRPKIERADHVSWSVPELEPAVRFFVEVLGARELWRLGPLDAREIPPDGAGRDWMATHVNVPDARLTLVMLELTGNLNLQLVGYERPGSATQTPPRNCDRGGHHLGLAVEDADAMARYLAENGCTVFEPIVVDEGPAAGRFYYVLDPWGHQIEICQYPKAS